MLDYGCSSLMLEFWTSFPRLSQNQSFFFLEEDFENVVELGVGNLAKS